MFPFLRRTATASMLLGAVVLAGCSTGSHTPGSHTPGSHFTGSHTAGQGGASSDRGVAATTPGRASSSTVHPAAAGGLLGGGDFCSAARTAQAQQEKAAASLRAASAASLQKFEQQAIGTLAGLVAITPSAIKSDVAVVVATDQKLYAALQAAHFEFGKVDPTVLSTLESAAFTRATTRIGDYLRTTCGISE